MKRIIVLLAIIYFLPQIGINILGNMTTLNLSINATFVAWTVLVISIIQDIAGVFMLLLAVAWWMTDNWEDDFKKTKEDNVKIKPKV